ncbi:MAG: hypothetical protein QXH87_02315 [Candidatus Bathyarchaeia archaeon]
MAVNDKILKALERAINHLDNSISALKGKDENAFSSSVWHVAAELEYTLFLLSLAIGNGHDGLTAKLNPEFKDLQTDQVMSKVKDSISEAQKSIREGDLPNAYKNAYLARHFVFKTHESITKKKREDNKGKK